MGKLLTKGARVRGNEFVLGQSALVPGEQHGK